MGNCGCYLPLLPRIKSSAFSSQKQAASRCLLEKLKKDLGEI
jgi:hypothetical protein